MLWIFLYNSTLLSIQMETIIVQANTVLFREHKYQLFIIIILRWYIVLTYCISNEANWWFYRFMNIRISCRYQIISTHGSIRDTHKCQEWAWLLVVASQLFSILTQEEYTAHGYNIVLLHNVPNLGRRPDPIKRNNYVCTCL